MNKIRIMLVLCFALFVGGLVAGCSGMTDSYAERRRRFAQIHDIQKRQAVDDWDYLWLYERNSRLTGCLDDLYCLLVTMNPNLEEREKTI